MSEVESFQKGPLGNPHSVWMLLPLVPACQLMSAAAAPPDFTHCSGQLQQSRPTPTRQQLLCCLLAVFQGTYAVLNCWLTTT